MKHSEGLETRHVPSSLVTVPHHSKSEDGARLQKLLARAGVASRRAAEEMVAQGRVSVNGHVVTELGAKADPSVDKILVDGQPLNMPVGPATVLLFHKPTGVVTTRRDPEGRVTVSHYLPDKYKHFHPVGRLDFDTSGVLLLTDDGDLTQLLTHPSHGVEKVYHARVNGIPTLATIKKLEEGIYLEDGKTAPCKIRIKGQTEKNSLVQITLREGRNRQVRRMMDAVGHSVRALRRVKFAGLGYEELVSGEFRVLLPGEVHAMRKEAEKPKQPIRVTKPKPKGATRSKIAEPEKPKPAPKPAAKKAEIREPRPTAFKASAFKSPNGRATNPYAGKTGDGNLRYGSSVTANSRPAAQPEKSKAPAERKRTPGAHGKGDKGQSPLAREIDKKFNQDGKQKVWGQQTRKHAR